MLHRFHINGIPMLHSALNILIAKEQPDGTLLGIGGGNSIL